MDIESAVQQYVELRDRKDRLNAENKQKVNEIDRRLETIEKWFTMQAEKQGVESWRTDFGTVYFANSDFCSVGDWDEVLNFVVNNEAYDLLPKRVNKSAVREYLDANDELPAGVNFGVMRKMYIRKPTKK